MFQKSPGYKNDHEGPDLPDLRTTLADLVHDLVDPYEHAETITLRHPYDPAQAKQEIRIHRVRFPSLLDQLAAAVEPSGGIGAARGYESSPAASLDAVDLLLAIEQATAEWSPAGASRSTAIGALRWLVGAALTEAQMRDAVRVVGHWVTAARLITRWDSPAIRPRGSCPHCDSRGGIRVRLDPASAVCVDCRATWEGDGEIVVLANHIKWSNGELEPAEATA